MPIISRLHSKKPSIRADVDKVTIIVITNGLPSSSFLSLCSIVSSMNNAVGRLLSHFMRWSLSAMQMWLAKVNFERVLIVLLSESIRATWLGYSIVSSSFKAETFAFSWNVDRSDYASIKEGMSTLALNIHISERRPAKGMTRRQNKAFSSVTWTSSVLSFLLISSDRWPLRPLTQDREEKR